MTTLKIYIFGALVTCQSSLHNVESLPSALASIAPLSPRVCPPAHICPSNLGTDRRKRIQRKELRKEEGKGNVFFLTSILLNLDCSPGGKIKIPPQHPMGCNSGKCCHHSQKQIPRLPNAPILTHIFLCYSIIGSCIPHSSLTLSLEI